MSLYSFPPMQPAAASASFLSPSTKGVGGERRSGIISCSSLLICGCCTPPFPSFRLLSAGIAAAGTEKEGGRQKSGKQPNNLDSFQPSFPPPPAFFLPTYVVHLFCEREVRRCSEILPLLSRLLSLRVHHPASAEAESDGMPQKKKKGEGGNQGARQACLPRKERGHFQSLENDF